MALADGLADTSFGWAMAVPPIASRAVAVRIDLVRMKKLLCFAFYPCDTRQLAKPLDLVSCGREGFDGGARNQGKWGKVNMMNDLDGILVRLADRPFPPNLATIDDGVLARIGKDGMQRSRRGIGIATLSIALLMGIAGAVMPARDAAAASLAPLGPMSPLSPAALLGTAQ